MEIRVFCLIGRKHLEHTPRGLVCTRCMEPIATPGSKLPAHSTISTPGRVCAAILGPAVASSLALSGCAAHSSSSSSHELPRVGVTVLPGNIQPGSYPVAAAVPGHPGVAISPYTGGKVDVSNNTTGELVSDPSFSMDDRRFFRVP